MVRVLASVIERAGASRDRFFSLAGIDPASIDDNELRLPLDQYLRAIDAALTVSGDPAFGLHMGEHARPVMFDVLGPLAEHAATLRESIEAMARYSRLVAEGQESELIEKGELVAIRYPALRGDAAVVRVTAEFTMTALLSSLRLFIGAKARPTQVAFAYPAPPYVAEYERIFGGAARFAQAFTQMEFPSSWLDRAHPYKNPDLYALLKTQAERSLGRLERDASLGERIELIMQRHGPGKLTMDDVARELDMSVRSLRRKMQAEGVRYGELVARNQVNIARRMLEQPGASIQETAHAMGFATAAAFHRAFKRWTGMTPKQYRDSF